MCLRQWKPDLVLAQEPWDSRALHVVPEGYELTTSTGLMAIWSHRLAAMPQVVHHSNRWQELNFDTFAIHQVYLSPSSSKDRRSLLEEIADTVANFHKPLIVAGDFNLAPQLEDGVFGIEASRWTRRTERAAFERLLVVGCLADSTRAADTARQEFTFERHTLGKELRFRCDLALISLALNRNVFAQYDHSVRIGPSRFTDHSAVVIDMPYPKITEQSL